MKLYLYMLLEGSVCTLLYFVINYATPYELSLKQRSFYLRANILLYLIPFPWLFFQGKVVLEGLAFMLHLVSEDGKEEYVTHPNALGNSLRVTSGHILQTITGHRAILWIGVGIAALMMIVLVVWIWNFASLSRKIRKRIHIQTEYELGTRRIPIASSYEVESPVTIGFFKHVVVFPANDLQYETEKDGIIKHEMQHIRGKDGLFRFLSWIVVSMGWWALGIPVFLYLEHRKINEYIADQAAMLDADMKERKQYAKCVVESAQHPVLSRMFFLHLDGNGKKMEVRITRIMNNKIKKLFNKYLAFALVIVAFAVSSIPALAYEESKVYEETNEKENDKISWKRLDYMTFQTEEKTEEKTEEYGDVFLENMIDVHYLVFENMDGDIELLESEGNRGRVFCFHNYVSGTVSLHYPQDDGGCIVEVYRAERCTICGRIKEGEKLATHHYYTCPHNY